MDDPTLFGGPDKRVPPKGKLGGRACHARRRGLDNPTWRGGRDERVPPRNGPDKRVPPKVPRGLIAPGSQDLFTNQTQTAVRADDLCEC